jgi:hypothetical protein
MNNVQDTLAHHRQHAMQIIQNNFQNPANNERSFKTQTSTNPASHTHGENQFKWFIDHHHGSRDDRKSP